MKRLMFVSVALLVGFGLCRAARFRFEDKEDAVRAACRAELQKLGLTMAAAKAKYPTPEIHDASSACILPGATGEVVVRGKFAPGTKFIFQNDNIEVVKESLTGGEYRATVKAAPGVPPQTASVMAISPVTGVTVRRDNAAVIGGNLEWNMDASNGWRVLARSTGNACASPGQYPYDVSFFRKGESAPFEKRRATLYFSLYDSTNYSFSISKGDAVLESQTEDAQTLMKQMSDPKLTDAQRQKVMEKIAKMQEQLMARAKTMTDPANIAKMQQAEKQFGCERIYAAVQGASIKGRMRCSDQVGTNLTLTGTVKPL